MPLNLPIPYNFTPRSYQLPFFRAMQEKNRACLVWHRRSGKSKSLMNFTIMKAMQRKGVYYHAFPEYGQGRKILWDGIDKDGFKVLDHIPPALRKSVNKQEMKIEFANGSIWQIIGADNYDSLVGPNPVGLILDEWAVSDRYPQAWDYFRPILAENGGWAVFPYTPRGRNHGFSLYQMALTNPEWFCQLLTVEDTGVIPLEAIAKERTDGMPETMIQQEFYCSFLASSENIVIPFELIQAAIGRPVKYDHFPRYAGADPARFGDDRFGFVIRQGGEIIHVEWWKGLDAVQSTAKIIDKWNQKMFDVVAVDTIGVGGPVYDLLRNAKVPAVAVNVSEATSDKERFLHLRDELWWKVRQWFEDKGCSISLAIPEEKRNALIVDLQDMHYEYTGVQKIKVESKDEIRERTKKTGAPRSPDLGDALCCTFAPHIEMMIPEHIRNPLGHMTVHLNRDTTENYDALRYGLSTSKDLYHELRR